MNTLTCAICGATLQTSGDVCAEAAAKGWEIADGGARCKKCRMAGTSGKFPEIPGNSRLTDAEIDELEKLAGEATPAPWATYENSQDVFGRKPYDWFQIYAMIDGEMWVIMCANGNMVELEECQLPATEKTVRRKQAPGQAGKNARYVAAANPAAVLSLITEVRAARAAGKD